MSMKKIRHDLLDGGLHKESVDRLLDHYQSMQTRLQEGEYDEAGTHIGNFCENMVNILLHAMGESIQQTPSLGTFVDDCLDGRIGLSEPDSVRLQIPRTIRAAYDIRSNRDSVHVNLQTPVNHADTQTGIAMCSWMLAEVLRVYGDDTDDMEEIADLIEELAEPVSDGNPLSRLESSHEDFDRHSVAETLHELVLIAEDDVQSGPELSTLSGKNQVIAILAGRRAADDLDHLEQVGVNRRWISERVGVGDERVRQIVQKLELIQDDSDVGGFHIPGFRIQEAMDSIKYD
jgi:hypothetical protein